VVNYEELDGILDTIEELFSSLAERYEHRLAQVSIERWRWDEPVITLTWVGSDDIRRNIHALIVHEGSYPYELLLEANAWEDRDLEEGKITVRNWRHDKVGRVQIPFQRSELQKTVNEAYSTVSSWSGQDLKEQTHLAPWTAGPQPPNGGRIG